MVRVRRRAFIYDLSTWRFLYTKETGVACRTHVRYTFTEILAGSCIFHSFLIIQVVKITQKLYSFIKYALRIYFAVQIECNETHIEFAQKRVIVSINFKASTIYDYYYYASCFVAFKICTHIGHTFVLILSIILLENGTCIYDTSNFENSIEVNC